MSNQQPTYSALFREYINPNIQLDPIVIEDILYEVLKHRFSKQKQTVKMLIFGLGWDSALWQAATDGGAIFVENNEEYISLNSNIPANKIIKYNYKSTTVESSIQLFENGYPLPNTPVPQPLLTLAPFDIILIDGPEGYTDNTPGRLLPCLWSVNKLSHNRTIIYVDDAERPLEALCIENLFPNAGIISTNRNSQTQRCAKFIRASIPRQSRGL